ncbi:MAG: RluA family pseudouridine synthase [Chlamydiales bacterium]
MKPNIFIVSPEEKGLRLDRLLAFRFPHHSRHYFQYLIENKYVLVNEGVVKKAFFPKIEDTVQINWIPLPDISLVAEPIPLEILYEDDDLLIVNKPAAMVVHPAVGNWKGTFVNALLHHCKHLEKGNGIRPGIVHRLDKDTSGALIAAKSERAKGVLVEAFAHGEIYKEYLAICWGNPGNRLIESRIARHPIRRKEMAVVKEKGKLASTFCETLDANNTFSFVRLFPKTGRTHQLRVHLKSVGCPILGDPLYGKPSINQKYEAARQLLHAHTLRFLHPIRKNEIEVTAPLPDDIKKMVAKLQLCVS